MPKNRKLYRKLIYLFLFTIYACLEIAFARALSIQARIAVHLRPPLALDSSVAADQGIREIIAPYRAKLRRVLSRQIAHSTQAIELAGVKDSSLGPLLAKFLLEEANLFSEKYQYPPVDLGFMGFHGVRKSRLQGSITIVDLYELMPFENTLSIVALSGQKLRALAERFVTDQVLHPLYGMQIWLAGRRVQKMLIRGKAIEPQKTYYVAVPSYWAEGGDGMQFFTQSTALDTRVKIRDLFIKHLAFMQDLRPTDLPKLWVHGLSRLGK